MTWGRLDDKTASSPEWVGIHDAALKAAVRDRPGASLADLRDVSRHATQRAKGVHLLALMWTVPALTDGRITPATAEQICAIGSFTMDEFDAAAALLTASGAWKVNKRSPNEPFGSWSMKLGWKPGEQPTADDEIMRLTLNALRTALGEGRRDYPNKVQAIARAAGYCEYCDAFIGDAGGQIDHIDPSSMLSNELDAIAHVCAKCNRRKGRHSLEAVGMQFTARAAAARAAWVTRDVTRHEHATSSVTTSRAVVPTPGSGSGTGTGRAKGKGSGSGAGSGRGRGARP